MMDYGQIMMINCGVGSEIIFNFIKLNLCGYSAAYILVRGVINIIRHSVILVAFKSCALFTKCITKPDGTTIDNVEDLDLFMPIYNLIEYNLNYFETTWNLWFH